jgi:hypothetical protein
MLTMVGIPWEKAIYGFESVLYLAEHGKKLGVYEQRLGAGMVGCVDNLFRGQSHVHGHHHRSHHRDGEVALKVTMAIPVHHRHGVAVFDAQPLQTARKLTDTVAQCPVVKAHLVAMDDLLFAIHGQRREQQLPDQKRVGISRSSTISRIIGHIASLARSPSFARFSCMENRDDSQLRR